MKEAMTALSALLLLAASPCWAQSGGAGTPNPAEADEEAPTPAPLTVGSMAIASDPALAVEDMAVTVESDAVTYAYRLRNKGKGKLALAASVALPDLEVNNEADTTYFLPAPAAENPVDLVVKSNGAVVGSTVYEQAFALGIDRLAELKAAGLPLIPFGEATEKALAATKPDQLAKLVALGLVTPPDSKQTDAPVIADWTLHVVHGWTQMLEPDTATNVTVSFKPVKATYSVDVTGLAAFDALKDQVCIKPAQMAAAKALLKAKGARLTVDDITLANDGPARWLDNPPATVAVRKPQPTSVVAFCGMTAASSSQPVVTGTMPGSSEAAGLRVLIFSSSN